MLETLCRLADALDDSGAVWALGGSWVLYRVGAISQPRDVDVVLTGISHSALLHWAQRLGPVRSLPADVRYVTEAAYSVTYEGLEVELLLNFGVQTAHGAVRLELQADRPFERIEAPQRSIPVCSLEVWHFFYGLMGDPKGRVPMIEARFLQEGVDRNRLSPYGSQALQRVAGFRSNTSSETQRISDK